MGLSCVYIRRRTIHQMLGIMYRSDYEDLEVYQLSEDLSDVVWQVVSTWHYFEKDTVGKQLVRAADSVGANIVEGAGRGSFGDNRRFVRIARASLYETRYWLRRAKRRNLLKKKDIQHVSPLIQELVPRLNAYLNSIGRGVNSSD